MVPEDWQVVFSVQGLRAPDELQLDDSILIKGTIHDSAHIFLKGSIIDEDDRDRLFDASKLKLKKILQIYGLISNFHASTNPGYSAKKISSESPFGVIDISIGLTLVPVVMDNQRKEHEPLLKKTLEKYTLMETRGQTGFLLNAIDYYHRSLGDTNRQEKLIDSMICLESLFSGGGGELRLRYSLRMAHLLGVLQKEKIPKIFNNVYSLYDKRNKVVHGVEGVELDDKKIWKFLKNLKEAIKLFIHIETSKDELLKLLDESVYDVKKRKKLKQKVTQSISKW